MSTRQPKKMLAMQILDVLNRHSDAEHRLSQRDIARLLETEHQVRADRGTIKRNLLYLVDYGHDIEWTEITRGDSVICTGWYIQRLFEPSELRLLMDSLFFSRYVPKKAGRDMIGKLQTLASRHFKAGVSSMSGIHENALTNPQLFYNIQILDEAIQNRRQVSFTYNSVGTDLKLRLRVDRGGQAIRYLVNPYRLVVANGRHYLIGNHDRHRNLAHLRIDRITDIVLEDSPMKPLTQLEGLAGGLRLPTHMAEHIYMFSGGSELVEFIAPGDLMDSIVDWFGTGIKVREEGKGQVAVTVSVNKTAMRYWALQYARFVTLRAPQDLVDQVRGDLAEAARRYKSMQSDQEGGVP